MEERSGYVTYEDDKCFLLSNLAVKKGELPSTDIYVL